MSYLKSRLLGCLITGLLGACVAVGCSASGDIDFLDDLTTEESPTEKKPNTMPPPSSNPDDDEYVGARDGGKTDASNGNADGGGGSVDAGVDSGPALPEPGDACTTIDETFKRSCGKCGIQEAICLANNAVSDYGACTNENGACVPGSTQACGNCGTQTCSNSCNWGTCSGQPQNSCSPGAKTYTAAGCVLPQTYRERTCEDTCTWGQYAQECGAVDNPNKLIISNSVNGVVTGSFALSSSKVGKRSPSSCPTSFPASTTNHPYELIEIINNTSSSANVTLSLSGSPSIDTIIAVYATTLAPTTDAELNSCVVANDDCFSSSTCSSPWSEVVLTIPAGNTNLLRVSAYNQSTGSFVLSAKTNSLN